MNLDLSGKLAVVCGSTQGIGLAVARELAGMGASVALVARDAGRLQAACDSLPVAPGASHHVLVADFAQPAQLKAAIGPFSESHQATILVNNTGGPPAGRAIDAEIDDFERAFQAHLVCNQLLAQALVPAMKAAQYGRIINIISTSVKAPIPGLGVSNTIRGAVANWAKTLSVELAPFGITVNNVLPGATKTTRLDSIIASQAAKSGRTAAEAAEAMKAQIPARRFAEAHEVAAAAAFLASPAAGYINGINVPVDGGRTGSL